MSGPRKLSARRQTIASLVATRGESSAGLVRPSLGNKSDNVIIFNQQVAAASQSNKSASRVLARRNSSNSSVDSASSEFFSQLAALQLIEEQEHQSASQRVDYLQEARRTRHLLARFHLWRSKSESRRASSASYASSDMSTDQQPVALTMSQDQTQARLSPPTGGLEVRQANQDNPTIETNCPSQQQYEQHIRQHRRPSISYLGDTIENESGGGGGNRITNINATRASDTISVNLVAASRQILSPASTTTSLAMAASPPLAGDAVSERRLWQSLVMPLVLGCVIFLIAVWTRQVSLALTNDTIIMIMILAAVFIVMSGVAFWLSYDQQLEEVISSGGQVGQFTCCQHHAANGLHAGNSSSARALELDGSHTYHAHHLHNHQHAASQLEGSHKCCATQLVDCLPPDYHSAMRNSLPVRLFYTSASGQSPAPLPAAGGHKILVGGQENFNSIAGKLTTDNSDQLSDIQSLSNFSLPPSYDELTLVIDMDYQEDNSATSSQDDATNHNHRGNR